MVARTEKSSLDLAQDKPPMRVSLWARASDGTLVPVFADSLGHISGVGGSGGNPAGDGAVGTGTVTSVNDTASSTTILAANTARYGATVYNDSTAILYLLVAAGTASATNFTVKLQPDQLYEVPFGYTGILVGIWSSDASGAARVTEYT